MAGAPILALVGLRGSGKSTLGRALAERLGRPFVDLDDELWRHAGGGQRSAGALLAGVGETAFRELEAHALRDVLRRPPPFVLATGGGAIEREENRALLATHCRCAWLQAPLARLAARIERDPVARPRLGGGRLVDELAQLAARRGAWYRALAGEPISTDGATEAALERLLVWARGVEARGGSG